MAAKGKVFVGLSGGVDSAVSAALLKEQGYDVTGVFIRIAIPGYPCTAGEDKIDAQRVTAHLRIPFIEIDLSKEYTEEVFKASIEEFRKGKTPNPDTLCNEKIKFGSFYNFAKSKGADFIATGHYARSSIENGRVLLLKGIDEEKDQSYFLWMVPEAALKDSLFPVGHLKKPQVRELAKKFGLPNAKRKDSQGLCFLGDISINDMLERELSPKLGNILNEQGEIIGTHTGAMKYTLGQRHGFELSQQTGEAHYIIGKNIEKNTITASTSPFPSGVSSTRISLSHSNWIGEVRTGAYLARYRYRQALISAELSFLNNGVDIVLNEPHYAPIGQSLVLYENERCLGGGVIGASKLTD